MKKRVNQEKHWSDICISVDSPTLNEIRKLRKKEYRDIYPTMDLDNDVLDESALTLYTRNNRGEINSTARLAVDGPHGFPEDDFLEDYREQGKRMVEWGRFIIVGHDRKLLRSYYRTVFNLALNLNVDAIVMAMKPKDIKLHKRLVGLKTICPDMGINYGGPHSLACVVWEIEKTKKRFFKWIGGGK